MSRHAAGGAGPNHLASDTWHLRTCDAQDRLTTYGDWTYTYTNNSELGTKTNVATGEAWAYEYDVMGNLLSVDTGSGEYIEYLVDGSNRRIAKKVNGTVVRQWLYHDGLNPIAEFDGAGNLLYRYVYASMAHSPDFLVTQAGTIYRCFAINSDHHCWS